MGRVSSLAHCLYGEDPDGWDEAKWLVRMGQVPFVLETLQDMVAVGVGKALAAAFGKG